MNQSTEEELLLTLSKHQSLTILELSTILNLTKADIRYHINKLIKKGQVIKEEPISGLPGRPAARFKVSPALFEDNFELLIDGLISIYDNKSELFSKLEKYFLAQIKLDKESSLLVYLIKFIQIFENFHYKARWETHFHGPVVFFNNCPYRKIIHKYPELCEVDRMIIEKSLNQEVNSLSTIAKNSRFCQFQIILKSPKH